MGRKTKIAIVTGVVLVLLGAGAAYAYDSSQKDKIADGVTIGGVDVGGMNADEAKVAVRAQLLDPLSHSLKVGYDGESWKLSGKSLKIHADLDTAVEQALDESQDGGLPGRLVRYVTGGDLDERVPADITYSQPAVNRFVRSVAEEIDREPQDASVNPSGDTLEVAPAEYGRKLRDNLLTEQINSAVLNADADHTLVAVTHNTKPEVTGSEVAAEYPVLPHPRPRDLHAAALGRPEAGQDVHGGGRGWKAWKPRKASTRSRKRKKTRPGTCPNPPGPARSPGSRSRPGPENPIKARWMGIFEGAGIHGTEETYSLGSAASHGCVRMSIPDVEELYDRVEVGTPIYIG